MSLTSGMEYARFEPDILKQSLKTRCLGRHVTYCEEASSTNAVADAVARSGCPEGAVVIAERQTGGRGRLGRHWHSPAGKNLYLSIVLRPRMTPAEAAQLTLLAAVAVADTMREFVREAPRIKWPNDVLLSERKASGILCELATAREKVDFVIVGIGVNLNYRRQQMPLAIREIATSLQEESGREVDRLRFTTALIENFESRYLDVAATGFREVARSWNAYARLDGQWMTAKVAGEPDIVGRARGLDDNGFLLLEPAGGGIHTVVSGDVSLLDASPKGY